MTGVLNSVGNTSLQDIVITSGFMSVNNLGRFGASPVTAVALGVFAPFAGNAVRGLVTVVPLEKVLTEGEIEMLSWIAGAMLTAAVVTACSLPLSAASALDMMVLALCQKGFFENAMAFFKEGVEENYSAQAMRYDLNRAKVIATTLLTLSALPFKASMVAAFAFSRVAVSVVERSLVAVKPLEEEVSEYKAAVAAGRLATQLLETVSGGIIRNFLRGTSGPDDNRWPSLFAIGRRLRESMRRLERIQDDITFNAADLWRLDLPHIATAIIGFLGTAVGLTALTSFAVTPLVGLGLAVAAVAEAIAIYFIMESYREFLLTEEQ